MSKNKIEKCSDCPFNKCESIEKCCKLCYQQAQNKTIEECCQNCPAHKKEK